MIQNRPARPTIATVICVFEVVAAFLAALAHTPRRFLHIPGMSGNALYHVSLLHLAVIALGYGLGVAGAYFLWNMDRTSFLFFAARVVFSVTLFTIQLPNILRRWPEPGEFARVELHYFAVLGISVFALIVNALIAWYAFEVTKPAEEFYAYPT